MCGEVFWKGDESQNAVCAQKWVGGILFKYGQIGRSLDLEHLNQRHRTKKGRKIYKFKHSLMRPLEIGMNIA